MPGRNESWSFSHEKGFLLFFFLFFNLTFFFFKEKPDELEVIEIEEE